MVRVFGTGDTAEDKRCTQLVHDPINDKFCYLCKKYSQRLTEPVIPDYENGATNEDLMLTELYDRDTKEVFWRYNESDTE